MENLPLSLRLVFHLRRSIAHGRSARNAVEEFCSLERNNTSSEYISFKKWFLLQMAEPHKPQPFPEELGLHGQSLLYLIQRGLRGEAIAVPLKELEVEFIELCHEDIDRFASKLPVHLMALLTGFAFPAFLLLLIGPLAAELMRFY